MHEPNDSALLLHDAAQLLRKARRVAALTGAGVSAESGVPTFRGSDGLWEGHRIEEVATPQAFAHCPELVWRFYNQRRANLRNIAPNPGHYALVDLESNFFQNDRFSLITQNVDGLHRLAGNQRVFELHGNITRTRCTQCGRNEARGLEPLDDLPRCRECHGLLRPDIVWFYEALPEDVWDQAANATAACDVFLVIGTSAVVYPAAGLVSAAKEAGATVIEINLNRSGASSIADLCLLGPSGILLPQLVNCLRTAATS